MKLRLLRTVSGVKLFSDRVCFVGCYHRTILSFNMFCYCCLNIHLGTYTVKSEVEPISFFVSPVSSQLSYREGNCVSMPHGSSCH
jgi:hypothetical protein